MCHRCDLFKERQGDIEAAMKRVDDTFFQPEPPWGHYDPDEDPTGDNDPMMQAIAELDPCEAFLLGVKLTATMGPGTQLEKTSQWVLAALCAPKECPT